MVSVSMCDLPAELERSAGSFDAWLHQFTGVLRGERDADVPCDGCVGCCVSAYPIPLRPTDTVALEEVPDRYLQWPSGVTLARMLHREDGSCPMFAGTACRIYAGRPQTCRDYDCRLYAACGSMPDGERPAIRARVVEWRFTYADEAERGRAAALRRAAEFMREHASLFPEALRAHSATAAAVIAVKVYELFYQPAATQEAAMYETAAIGLRVHQIQEALRAFHKKGPEGPFLQNPEGCT